MNEQDRTTFNQLLAQHFACYPNARQSEATAPAWWADLKPYPLVAVAVGLQRARRSSPEYCPSCEQVRQAAEAEAKTLAKPVPNLEQKCLPEPPVTVEEGNPFKPLVDAVVAGRATGKAAIKMILDALTGEKKP